MKTTLTARIAGIVSLAAAFAASHATLAAAAVSTAPSSVYNLTGFAAGATGGGMIDDTDAAYRKVTTALEFITAIRDSNKTAGAVKVIEIMNDLDLGWNEIGTEAQNLDSNPARAHVAPKLHPTLITSGVTLLDIQTKGGGLTIFSAAGATIRHCTFNIKSTSNIIIRNLKFDEMWEWDEETKGNYDGNDWDFITLGNGGDTTDIWIDHCTFTKAYDGITDMKAKASNITYSWCRIEGGDDAPGGFIRQQIDALEANKSGTTVYKFLRDTAGFTVEELAFIMRGQKKGILMGPNNLDSANASLSATFHHILMTNLWDRALPRLRGGNVHIYNVILDDTEALESKRMISRVAATLDSADKSTLQSGYHFNPPLNGAIATEDGAILLEKSIYTDCLWPLRNNQADPSNAAYTGKILGLDVIYNFDSTTIRGNSTDTGNPLGPFQAAIKPFSWNFSGGSQTLPYTIDNMDDPSVLPAILDAGAGAGVIEWNDTDGKYNWLKTSYPAAPASDTAPVITLQPKSQSVVEGHGVTLSVAVIARPAPTYQWYKGASLVSGGTAATLTIPAVAAGDAGAYHVVVSNGVSPEATSDTATISLTEPPAVPVAAAATKTTGEGFTANWTPSPNATGYTIDVSPDPTFANCWPGYENLAVGDVASHAITGLSPATTYYYRVRATVGSYNTADSNVIDAATSNTTFAYVVDDAMDDTDRIGGTNGSNTSSSSPEVSTPASTNTQWIVSRAKQMVASATGLKWTFDTTSNVMALGYMPNFSVPVGKPATLTLNFTTGTLGTGAGNMRIALLNDTAGGRRTTDGISASNETACEGDIGYGFFAPSTSVAGNASSTFALKTYKRVVTNSADILGTDANWGNAEGTAKASMANSPAGATGMFASSTDYSFVITLTNDGTNLSIRFQITGGDFTGYDYTATESIETAILTFNTIALRFDKGSGQFDYLNFTGLTVTQDTGTTILSVPAIYSAPTAAGAQGTAFSYACVATNGAISYSATGLPAGLNINASGVISGTPTEYGTFDAIITASNANGEGGDFTLSLTIEPEPPAAPTAAEATARTAEGFTANWTAVPGATGYQLDIATDSGFATMVAGYENLDVGDVTNYAVTGLDAATTYYCRVSAVTESVVGTASAAITIATASEGGGSTGDTILLNDSFTDGNRTTQNLPSSANWMASTASFTVAEAGSATLAVSSSRTALFYFTNDSSSPVSLAAGETLKLEFTGQYSAFDSSAGATTNTMIVGLLHSVANGAAVDGTGFVASGSPNTNARVTGDFGSSNPNSNAFSVYTGYGAFTRPRDAANDTPVTFRVRNLTDPSLVGKTNAYTALANTETPTASTAMVAATDYRYTFTLTRNDTGGMVLTYKIAKVSDDTVVMAHSTVETTASYTEFDTAAIFFSSSSSYNFTFKNATITKTAPASAPETPALAEPNSITADGFTANWNTVTGATGYYLDVSTDPNFGSFVSGYENLYVGNNLNYAITGLDSGVTYYYRVRAANADGISASSGASTAVVTSGGGGSTYLVNDTFTDYDRIGGLDGSATAPGAPEVNTPTATNTQWVASSTNALVATGTGMVWGYTGNSTAMTIGYFPEFTVATSSTYTVQLKFTTGLVGSGTDNLRIALIHDGGESSRVTTDGVAQTSESKYSGDTGYAFTSASGNVGNASVNFVMRTYKRIKTGESDLLSAIGNWGTSTSASGQIGNSSGATGYFQEETDYTLTLTLANNGDGTAMAIGAKFEGGNFNNLSYSVTDSDTSVAINKTFNALVFRLGKGALQFSQIKFTGLKIWEGEEPSVVPTAPVITSPATATATQNTAFTYNITASGSPTSYALASGTLPAGVTLNTSTGVISGTPTESGTFNVTLTATNGVGTSAPHALAITVASAITEPPVINSDTTATAVIGAAFTYTITASNEPASFAATGLPASGNLTLDTSTGVISGTPAVGDLGTHIVTLTATNAIGTSAAFTLMLTVELPPALAAPVATTATGATTTSFIVRWESVTGATGYRLDVATDSGFTSFVPGYNNRDIGSMRACPVTGLGANTNYYYRLRAYSEYDTSAFSNVITVLTADQETVFVNDTMSDTDRIGGTDGSTTTSSSPKVSAPTAANTQWVASRVKQLIASATGGMKWNFDTTSAIGILGYFPKFSVANGQTVTIKLDFTTGTLGAGATNNLRIALLNGAAKGHRETDGFSVGTSGDTTFAGDVGYGFFTNSQVGGSAASPVTLANHKRLTTDSVNLLGAVAEWGDSISASGTPASGHLFESNKAYSLIITLTRDSSTSLSITSQITGGALTGLITTATDASQPISAFDTLAFRLGGGSNQFSHINITSLRIATTGNGAPSEPPVITSDLTATATRGEAFTYTIDADNLPTMFSAEGLPSGLDLPDPTTGVILGTPSVTGTFEITLGASNAIGTTTKTLVLQISAGESASTTIVPPGGGLASPAATTFDAAGNACIADLATGEIKKVAPDGTVSTLATIPQLAVLASDGSGNLHAATADGSILKVAGDGSTTTLATGVTDPGGVAIATDGTVYVSKTSANTIVKITSAGAISTLAGSGSAGSADATGTAAAFNGPTGLAINNNTGVLYVADTVNSTIRAIDLATGAVTTVAGQAGVTGDHGSEGSDGKATDGTLNTPEAIVIDDAGLLYIADTGNNLIRGFDPVSGALTTLAGDAGAITLDEPAGLAFSTASGLLTVADTGNGTLLALTIKPIIAAQIVNRVAPLGSTVTLDGTAWASPAAAYQWTVHGTTPVGNDAILEIAVNSVTDSGVYAVTATNSAGSGSASLRITVSGNGSTSGPNADSSSGGGGGGAPSFWILGAIVLLVLARKISARRTTKILSLLAFLSLFSLHSSPFAFAQQTRDDVPPPLDDEVITMSAFEVTSQSVKGYVASESVTGTRVASLLRELPFNVNVVTDEFIADFNAFDLSEQLSNVSSFSPSENIGQYQLRGFTANTQLVDGFRRVGLTGVTATERVEVIKGPAASIYGAIQPGGAVNTLRKKPSNKPKYGLTLGVGTHDQVRTSAYATGPVGNSNKLFYRLDTEYRRADRQQEHAKTRTGYASLQLAYKPSSRTTLNVSFDHADRHDFNSSQIAMRTAQFNIMDVPLWFTEPLDGIGHYVDQAFSQYFGQDYDFYDSNLPGPNANRFNRLTAGSVTLDHKFSAIWSLRASFNMSTSKTHGEKATTHYYPYGYERLTSAMAEAPQAVVRIRPQHDEGRVNATGFQIDNLFRFTTGPVKHQLLVTLDYYRNSDRSRSITWANPFYYDPADPYSTRAFIDGEGNAKNFQSIDYPTWEEDPSPYITTSDDSKAISRDYGLFISERATVFNGRLIAMAGVRYDYVDSFAEHMPTTDYPEGQTIDYAPDAWTYQAGITVILTRNISAYANASSSFDPQPQLDEKGNALPNIESDGWEFGVKLTLLSERLNITLNRFHIRQKNLARSMDDPFSDYKVVRLIGEQVADGYEVDFNWQVTRAWNFIGGYGYVDAEITDAGQLNWLNGMTPRRVPKHNLGISTRYEVLHGPLKGLYATAGVTYYSKSLINESAGTTRMPDRSGTFSEMDKNKIHNTRFANGGLPYPYLPENAIITLVTPASATEPVTLYWTDVANPATMEEMKKYSYANPYLNGATQISNGFENIYNRSSVVWKMGVGYKFKRQPFGKALSHKIQINMDNVFNKKTTTAGGIPILERNVMVTYSVSF